MATPTQARAVSTPKPHLPNTPSGMLPSPRPGTSGKKLAYKSPAAAMKTPASMHLHGLSVSSQPSSTPLGAAAIHDELLNLNSPAAALINSIAQNNLTPVPMGPQDGLGITGHTPLTARDTPRNPETERLHRLQQALDKLRCKVIGRNVTRDGIKRVAQLNGLEAVDIDDDNLVVAGENIVEMEITFDSVHRNDVKDLCLKLNYDDETHVQTESTAMLKAQVAADASVDALTNFAHNVEYLAQLEKIDVKPNCFQLVNNLSACLQDVWKEEKKRMHWRSELHHLRKGAVGLPTMDRPPRLGLAITYWQKEQTSAPEQTSTSHEASSKSAQYRAAISCETGLPTMLASEKWLKDDILAEAQPGQNVLDAKDHVFYPNWQDSLAGLAITAEAAKDEASMEVDKKASNIPTPLDMHFTCNLEPEVLLPVSALSRLNNEIQMLEIDPSKAVTYQQTLRSKRNTATSRPNDIRVEDRWKRRISYVDATGKLTWHNHAYKLYSSTQDHDLWCYPVSKLRFNHPRQIADLLPLLRMHVVVWTLLDSVALRPPPPNAPGHDRKVRAKGQIVRRSNRPTSAQSGADATTNVDITIDFTSNSNKTIMEVVAPLSASKIGSRTLKPSMLSLTVQIKPNGVIEVAEIRGIQQTIKDSNSDLSTELRTKLAKILTATEDLGIAIQWLIQSRS
jgi:hypothetical protein